MTSEFTRVQTATASVWGRTRFTILTVGYSSKKKRTFSFGDEVLDNDIGHVVSIRVAILVEAVNRTEVELVAGDGPVLAAHHLYETPQCRGASH